MITLKLGKKTEQEAQEKEKTSDEELIACLGIQGYQVPEGYVKVEDYALNAPFSYAWIFQEESEGGFFYVVDELGLTKEERIVQAFKKHP